MNHSTRSAVKSLLRKVAWLFFGMAGVAVAVGGEVLSAFTGRIDQPLASLEGFALALPFVGLGILAKVAEDRLEEAELDGPTSLGEALRK
jgi:hypothetical protein